MTRLVAGLQQQGKQSCLEQAIERGRKSIQVVELVAVAVVFTKAGAFCSPVSVPVHLRAPKAKPRRQGEREDKKRTRLPPVTSRVPHFSSVLPRRRRRHCTSAAQVSCRPGDLSSSSISSLGGSLGVRGPRSVRILGV